MCIFFLVRGLACFKPCGHSWEGTDKSLYTIVMVIQTKEGASGYTRKAADKLQVE